MLALSYSKRPESKFPAMRGAGQWGGFKEKAPIIHFNLDAYLKGLLDCRHASVARSPPPKLHKDGVVFGTYFLSKVGWYGLWRFGGKASRRHLYRANWRLIKYLIERMRYR